MLLKFILFSAQTNHFEIDFSRFKNGYSFVRLKNSGKTFNQLIVK